MSDFTDMLDRLADQVDRMSRTWKDPIVFVIDPAGCGCTDCIVGDSIPEDQLTDVQRSDIDAVRAMNPLSVLDRR